MSIEEKLTIIAENMQGVYDAGYEKGKSEGSGDGWYDTFWDSVQENGNRTDYTYAFSYGSWNDTTFNPKYSAKPTSANSMFYNSKITNSEKLSLFDFSGCTNVSQMFTLSKFTSLPVLDFTSVTISAGSTFQACAAESIEKIIINTDGSFDFRANTFTACILLTEIRFEGVIGKSFYIKDSGFLSKDSIINIFEVLSSDTEGLSASFSKKAVDTAFETGEGLADGTSSTEWAELIATKPNWTITLV